MSYGQVDDLQSNYKQLNNRLRDNLHGGNTMMAKLQADSLISLAKVIGDEDTYISALGTKYRVCKYMGEYAESISLMKEQLSLLKDPVVRASTYSNLGSVYQLRGDVDTGLFYAKVGLDQLAGVDDSIHSREIAYVINQVGVMYYAQGMLDSSAYYQHRAIDYTSPTDSTRMTSMSLNFAQSLMDMKNFEEAHSVTDRVVAMANAPSYKNTYAWAHRVKSLIYREEGKYEEAEKWAAKAVALHENGGSHRRDNEIYTNFAQALLKNNKIKEAKIQLAKVSKPDSESNFRLKANYYLALLEIELKNGNSQRLDQVYQTTARVVDSLGHIRETQQFHDISAAYHATFDRFRTAYFDLKRSRVLLDSITSKDNNYVVNNLQTKYQTSLKERQIAEQELALNKAASRQRTLLLGFISFLVMGGLIAWFWRRQSRITAELKEAEILSLKKENKLIAMQSILSGQEDERKRIAQDLHDNIGSLMSTIKLKILDIQKSIENVQRINIVGEVDDMIGQAATEIRRISHNMTPVAMDLTGLEGAIEDLGTQLRQGGIQTTFKLRSLDKLRDKQKQVIVYRVVQEIINNIGKHSGARTVFVESSADDKALLMRIEDDGKGMSREDWENGSGMGIKSIKSRIEYLEGEVIMDGTDGTVFMLKIPLL